MDIAFSRIVSCSHVVSSAMPHWPGDPVTQFETVAELERDGFALRQFCMGEHSGTHVNAPVSFLQREGGVSRRPEINRSEASRLCLDEPESTTPEALEGACSVSDVAAQLALPVLNPLVVFDIREQVATNADYVLSVQDVEQFEAAFGAIPRGAMVLLFTGWSCFWNEPERFLGMRQAESDVGYGGDSATEQGDEGHCEMHFPAFSYEAAKLLVDRGIRGLATDTHGLDSPVSGSFDVNLLLACNSLLAVECVRIMQEDEIPVVGAHALVAGLKLHAGTGSPVEFLVFVP